MGSLSVGISGYFITKFFSFKWCKNIKISNINNIIIFENLSNNSVRQCVRHTIVFAVRRWTVLEDMALVVKNRPVNDLIKRALASAEIPSRLEPSYLSRTNDRNVNKRPDGVSLVPWDSGKCLVWDFTCPDTFAQSHLNKAVSGQGAVASVAEIRKCTKYNHLAATMYNFVPVVVETLGSFGESANNFIMVLDRKITAVMGEKRATADFLRQRQRGHSTWKCCLCFGHR